ncbi:hypothetical protein [Leifsonia sp. LS-T14]|uniref:hypothetical protein n=1 Tax=unclassified Leifsonia TaxID=2663824 RepID=UPI0035A5C851
MGLRGILLTGAAAAAIVFALTGCTAAAATAPGSSAPAVGAASETPRPTPTAPAVVWQDAQQLIMLPDATTPDWMPHGPSWTTQDGTMMCGIYDDMPRYSRAKGDLGPGVYYGCRIQEGANRFAYPPLGFVFEAGGCPSGFAANGGEAATVLCNSGQVFSSETGSPTALMPGNGVRFAGVECVALPAGMSCTETATGHGFRATLDAFSLS